MAPADTAPPKKPSFAANMAISAAGPAFAAVFTNPADVAKTRLNMDRELQAVGSRPRYAGTFDCIRQVWASEGLAGVQRGLNFAMVREASKCSFRIGLHEPIVNAMHHGSGPAPFATKAIGGMLSGAISALSAPQPRAWCHMSACNVGRQTRATPAVHRPRSARPSRESLRVFSWQSATRSTC